MEVRRIKIKPEDEARLRELMKIYESEIDSYTDDQLGALEKQSSQKLQQLLHKQRNFNQSQSLLRFRLPLKAGTLAFLTAAAAMLFIQTQMNDKVPGALNLVSKGTVQGPALSCESTVVQSDGTTPDFDQMHYQVRAGQASYLKLRCGQPVFVHVGYFQGETLHLQLSNLQVSTADKRVVKGNEPVDFTALAQQQSGLVVIVSEKPLTTQGLSPEDRVGYWLEELPLSITR